MRKRFGGLLCVLIIVSFTIISWKPANGIKSAGSSGGSFTARELLEKYVDNVYESAHLEASSLSFNVFKKAFTGFLNIKQAAKPSQASSILTVIDFTKSSRDKRMWIIDVANKRLVLNTRVAHGEGSGGDIPTRFSDRVDSRESSLGFYITDDIYFGEHGRSMRLNGLDAGFNANARKRAIVVHAADYVCDNIINLKGRLGHSFGCPAVSPEVIDQVLDAIKDKSVIFINGNSKRYNSRYLDEELAAHYLAADSASNITASL